MSFLPADILFRSCLRVFTLVLLSFFAGMPLFAQGGRDSTGTGGIHKIQGRIYFPSGRRSDVMQVQVVLESTSSDRLKVIADLNGSFTFTNLSAGSYTVVVDAGQDYETARDYVVIESGGVRGRNLSSADMARTNVPRTFNVLITLRLKPAAARAGVVDASLANVPKAAVDAYQKAVAEIQAGHREEAVTLLKTALTYYPQFALARNELGVQYLKLGMPDKAVDAFRAALEIRSDDVTIRLNYGVALLEKRNFAEAEAQLRQVVLKNGDFATAHLYLGIALINLRKFDDAQLELERAVSLGRDSMSLAHYYLGGIFWRKRQYKQAADELETYLKLVPTARDAEQVRATIRDLRSKQTPAQLENSDLNKVKSVRSPQ